MSLIHRISSVRLYFLPVQTRVPLKFGHETLTSVTCARVALRVVDSQGHTAEGWGETPLSVQWVWPSPLPYEQRHQALKRFCRRLVSAWMAFEQPGHPLEVGCDFQEQVLPKVLNEFNQQSSGPALGSEGRDLRSLGSAAGAPGPPAGPLPSDAGAPPSMPRLAALVCNSPFDIALHDAFGKLLGRPVYQTYNADCLGVDLARFLQPARDTPVSFRGLYPADFLVPRPPRRLRAWHLVGGLDALDASELTGSEPNDGLPVTLADWMRRDGLKCLKVKLRGNDAAWDYERLVKVGRLAIAGEAEWLSADFNCTVQEPAYVNDILDRLRDEQPRLFGMILYVEQPFPYELELHPIDAHSVSARKPLFLDESAHDWRMVRLGRQLGWTGVALKTCKTQTGAVLSACWAKAHGLGLMVQDLTNPMLAQVPHALLAAHFGTIMGVETNAMQFYPAASAPEAKVHPGLYQRRQGAIDLSTLRGPGFGYRLPEISRPLPPADVAAGGE
jgi:L-alanine-DL-glutamate epimerase-like enolase superfamily enzyme